MNQHWAGGCAPHVGEQGREAGRMEITHGGDLVGAREQFAGEILDFSANLNPLGMPEPVRRAAERAVGESVHYPDPLCRALRRAIARRDGVEPDWVLCGNGAADLIFRLAFARPGIRALVTAPAFSEYEQALRAAGDRVRRFALSPDNEFDLTDTFLEELTEEVDLVFLCTPNNPTGRAVEPGLMGRILERCAEEKILLAVDECFLELSDAAEGGGLAALAGRYPNLLLLRAFTKSYAVPGLRLGYCICSDTGLLEHLGLCAQSWGVSAPAQAAGLAALGEPDWPRRARALIREERSWLEGQLAEMPVKVFHSTANYILFQAPGVMDLRERLLERGILIRACGNYPGLSGDYYRVAVRTHEENGALMAALREVIR